MATGQEATAEYKDGVLTIRVPAPREKAGTRTIRVRRDGGRGRRAVPSVRGRWFAGRAHCRARQAPEVWCRPLGLADGGSKHRTAGHADRALSAQNGARCLAYGGDAGFVAALGKPGQGGTAGGEIGDVDVADAGAGEQVTGG